MESLNLNDFGEKIICLEPHDSRCDILYLHLPPSLETLGYQFNSKLSKLVATLTGKPPEIRK